MKPIFCLFAAVLFCACVVPSQSPPPAGAVPPGSGASPTGPGTAETPPACVQEGNADAGDFDQPMAIEPGTLSGCVGTNDKIDTFALRAPDSATSTLYTIQLTPTKTLNGKLFDANRQQQVGMNAKAGEQSALWAVVAAGSTVYFKVDHYHTSYPENPYTLTVAATPIPEADEPNNDFDTAAPMELSTPHQAAMVNALNDDQLKADYYRIDVPRAGKLTVKITNATPTLQVRMKLYDSNRSLLRAASAPNPGALFDVTADAKKAGEYYVSVVPSYSSFKAAREGEAPSPMPSTYTLEATVN